MSGGGKSPIFLLPGTGADQSMYVSPWNELPGAVAIDWPVYRGEKSIAEVAARVAAENSMENDCVLVGSSLGGMVAAEIAAQVRPAALILVSSAKSHSEISGLLATLHPLIDLTPLELVRRLAKWVPTNVAQMFHRSDPDFIRAMCRAIFEWRGSNALNVPLCRIHGRYDPVIPLPVDTDHVIGGGHLITMTHASECVNIVRLFLDSAPDPRTVR